MCDYSLHGLPNRLAIEGEELVAHRFTTGAIGLTSHKALGQVINAQKRGDNNRIWSAISSAIFPPLIQDAPAVCVPPGALLRVRDIALNLQVELDIGPKEIVTFTQTGILTNAYHDAIRFSNGRQILLQALKEGQRVHVMSLTGGETRDLGPFKETFASESSVRWPSQFTLADVKQSLYLHARSTPPSD
jgi:hypothetical protein